MAGIRKRSKPLKRKKAILSLPPAIWEEVQNRIESRRSSLKTDCDVEPDSSVESKILDTGSPVVHEEMGNFNENCYVESIQDVVSTDHFLGCEEIVSFNDEVNFVSVNISENISELPREESSLTDELNQFLIFNKNKEITNSNKDKKLPQNEHDNCMNNEPLIPESSRVINCNTDKNEELPQNEFENCINNESLTTKSSRCVSKNDGLSTLKSSDVIMKPLSIKIDNTYSLQNKCLLLNKKFDKFFDGQNSIFKKIINLSQVFENFSTKSFSKRLILVNAELAQIQKLITMQKPTLISLNEEMSEILSSLSTLSYANDLETQLKSLSTLNIYRSDLKTIENKNKYLEIQINNLKNELKRKKLMYKNRIDQKDKYIHNVNKKNSIMRKRVTSLMNLLIENMGKNRELHITDDKDVEINRLKNENMEKDMQLDKKEAQIKKLKARVRTLNVEKRRMEKKIKVIRCKERKKNEEKDHEIRDLRLSKQTLLRQHDRWLSDRFYMYSQSSMLRQKIKQMELKHISWE